MFSSKNSMLVSRVNLEMSFWKEWSGFHRAESPVECRDEEVLSSRDRFTVHKDRVDSRQFLAWEDLIGQR